MSGFPEVLAVYCEYELVPTAMSTYGARRLMKRLTTAADVPEIDAEAGEYLELHGSRRGVGDTLVREKGQQLMRHNNPLTTTDSYSHISAGEVAKDAGDAFEQADGGSAQRGEKTDWSDLAADTGE